MENGYDYRPRCGEPVAQVCCGGIYLSHIPQKNQQVNRVEIAFQSSATVKCFYLHEACQWCAKVYVKEWFLNPPDSRPWVSRLERELTGVWSLP